MNEIAAYGGFPNRYPHWRFGMEYEQLSQELRVRPVEDLRDGHQQQPLLRLPARGQLARSIRSSSWRTSTATSTSSRTTTGSRKTNRKMIDEMANHATRVRRHMDALRPGRRSRTSSTRCLSLENLIDPMSPFIVRAAPTASAREEDEADERRRRGFAGQGLHGLASSTRRVTSRRSSKKREDEKPRSAKRFPEQPERDVLQFLLEHAPLEPGSATSSRSSATRPTTSRRRRRRRS